MSATPPDFPIVTDPTDPPAAPADDTGRFVTAREIKPMRTAVEKLVAIERERRGELRILTWIVGLAVPAGIAFFTWITLALESIRSDVRDITTRVELTVVSHRDHDHDHIRTE